MAQQTIHRVTGQIRSCLELVCLGLGFISQLTWVYIHGTLLEPRLSPFWKAQFSLNHSVSCHLKKHCHGRVKLVIIYRYMYIYIYTNIYISFATASGHIPITSWVHQHHLIRGWATCVMFSPTETWGRCSGARINGACVDREKNVFMSTQSRSQHVFRRPPRFYNTKTYNSNL